MFRKSQNVVQICQLPFIARIDLPNLSWIRSSGQNFGKGEPGSQEVELRPNAFSQVPQFFPVSTFSQHTLKLLRASGQLDRAATFSVLVNPAPSYTTSKLGVESMEKLIGFEPQGITEMRVIFVRTNQGGADRSLPIAQARGQGQPRSPFPKLENLRLSSWSSAVPEAFRRNEMCRRPAKTRPRRRRSVAREYRTRE